MNTYQIDATYTCHVLLTIKAESLAEALTIAKQGDLSHDNILQSIDGNYEDLVRVNDEDVEQVCNKHPEMWITHEVRCPICTYESNLESYEKEQKGKV